MPAYVSAAGTQGTVHFRATLQKKLPAFCQCSCILLK